MQPANETSHRLIQLGVLLFLLGLLTGFGIPFMASPRMGVSSHLEGVMNGTFLIALGLIWNRVTLGRWTERLAVGLAVFGTFANWAATLLTGLWGAGGMTPIAGGGAQGTPLQELIVGALLMSLSVSMVALCGLVLIGLARRGPQATAARAAVAIR